MKMDDYTTSNNVCTKKAEDVTVITRQLVPVRLSLQDYDHRGPRGS